MNCIYQEKIDITHKAGIIFGSFAPLHKGHLDLIYRAKKECDGVFVITGGYKNDRGYPDMPIESRYRMVRKYFQDDSLVAVYCMSDDELGIAEYTDQWDIWLSHLCKDVISVNQQKEINMEYMKEHVKFYVGERGYADQLRLRGFDVYLADRKENPISATMIRKNPLKYWDSMAYTYYSVFSHNILITGTASEGKTTLAQDIGKYFNIPYSHEWAKDYVTKEYIGDWEFDCKDFLTFLNGQYSHNQDCIKERGNKGIFISDTDEMVTKMYAKYYAMDPEMSVTMEDYINIIEPVADAYIKCSKWDKIFVIVPKGEFVNDHIRYLKHSSMKARNDLIKILFEEIEKAGLKDQCEILDGGYLDNFNRVKEYIEAKENEYE